jgi:PAS domain S-box-containing protein
MGTGKKEAGHGPRLNADDSPIVETESQFDTEPKFLDQRHLSTQAIDLDSLFTEDVTSSGSFDVTGVRLTSFGRLLNALPMPVLLVNRSLSITFLNEYWGVIDPDYQRILNSPFCDLFPEPGVARKAQSLIEQVFADRKAQVAKGLLQVQETRIWARMHCRSLRMGRQRFVLVPVENLTLEKEREDLQELHRLELQEAHDQLEIRVQARTSELVEKNVRLQQEITERKRVESALRASEERFRAVFESAEDLVFVKDASLRYTHINPAMADILGVPRSAVFGKSDEDLMEPELASLSREVESRVLAGQTIELEHSMKFVGPAITCSFVRVPLKDAAGAIVGLCGIGRDITERKSREKQMASNGRATPLDHYPSEAMQRTMKQLSLAASSDSTCLFQGESGTGKDFFARYLHDHSNRSGGPFFGINCAALVPELAESELFGHEAGAFTGAIGRKRGLLELAESGTLLLNEIGELAPQLQAKLLSFLDHHSFPRVGGEREISVNARLVASTNRDLVTEVKSNRFREDLFYRLNVLTIHIPPLRERLEDLPFLVQVLIESLAKRVGLRTIPVCSDEAMKALADYHWPGNVRELRNVLERALILGDGRSITAEKIGLKIAESETETGGPGISVPVSMPEGGSMNEVLREVKTALVEAGLQRSGGNVKEAARFLGISRDSLNHYIKSLGVRR